MRFLFFVPDMAGNSPPIMEVARRLVCRGHRVRMLAWPDLRAAVEASGSTYVPFNRTPVFTRDHLRQVYASSANEWFWLRDNVMFGQASANAKDVLEELSTHPADAIAVDAMTPGGLIGAEVAGIPRALLLHSIFPYPAPGLPTFGMGFPPPEGWLGRARDAIMRVPLQLVMRKGLAALNDARRELKLEPLSDMNDSILSAHSVLVMTSAAFDFEADELPPTVRYVGPQLEPETAGGWEPPWPASDTRPLVLVGLSTDQMGQELLLQKLIGVLSQLEVRALITTGPSIDRTNLVGHSNVVVREFVPHFDVMPKTDLAITHAGHGTVIRALAAGVPMVCIPLGRDQYDVAARVVWRGAGIKVSRKSSPAALKQAIITVLQSPRFGESSRQIAKIISHETAQDLAVGELEALVL